MCSDRTKGRSFKIKRVKFRLDIGKKTSTIRAVRHCHRLPREAVDAPLLEVLEMFKVRLDRVALSNLL